MTHKLALPAGMDESTVFRSLFSAYPDALLLVDAAGSIVLANPAAESLLGYAPGELLGAPVEALVPDSIRPRHAAYREAYSHAPRTRPMGTQMDLVAKRRDGSEVMVEIALSPLQNQGVPLVVAAIRDVASYPRVKQALQRARYSEHLAQLGRLAVDTRDPPELLRQVPAFAAQALEVEVARVFLLERDRRSFRLASGVGSVPGETMGELVPYLRESPVGFVLEQGCPVVIEDYASEARFEVPPNYLDAGLVSALAVPLSDRGRLVGVLSAHSRQRHRFGEDEQRFMDSLASLLVTSLQRAETEEALNHSQRMESVGQLTGGIAHDFNNLLTVIQGNLQVLEEKALYAGDVSIQPLVDASMRAARRGAELTGKLLAFSRRQVLQPSAVDVVALLHSLAAMLQRTLDQRIRIRVEVAEGCPPVMADPGQLESALLNIAINARDAMPDGGTLCFGAARAEVAEGVDGVAITVSDTGQGMPEAVRERAFEPFFTTKQAGRGTGLGLSTVYGFVTQSRGKVLLESTPGQGTRVRLLLPVARTEAPLAPDHEGEDGSEAIPAGLRVLLAEDDAEVRAVTVRFLDALGCRVTACASGEQALLALAPDPGFDLLLTDIALGAGMRGTRLAELVRQRMPATAVLLTSGFSAELLDADRESPADWELLPKPFTRRQLARAMVRALAA